MERLPKPVAATANAPERYFYPDQYNNPANWQAHFYGTGPEIWQQTDGRVTHFVAVVGTSGTLVGTARRLKQFNPAIQVVEVQPDGAFHGLEGMKHLPTALVPGIYDARRGRCADDGRNRRRPGRSPALWPGTRASWPGRRAGPGCWPRCRWPATLQSGVVVTILPDGGSRYLGDRFWDETGS